MKRGSRGQGPGSEGGPRSSLDPETWNLSLIHISFRNGHIVHRYLPASGGWSAVEAVATLDGYVEYRVAADSLGEIHLAWLDEANNQIDLSLIHI